MALTEFLKNLTSENLSGLAVLASENPQNFYSLDGREDRIISSGTSTSEIVRISKLLSERNRLTSINNLQGVQKNLDLAAENLINLGQSSVDISAALADQVAIREAQREADLGFSLEIQDQVNEINSRLSQQVTELGTNQAIENAGGGFFDGFSLPTFNDIKTPLIIAGGILGALIFLPRIIKSGFK